MLSYTQICFQHHLSRTPITCMVTIGLTFFSMPYNNNATSHQTTTNNGSPTFRSLRTHDISCFSIYSRRAALPLYTDSNKKNRVSPTKHQLITKMAARLVLFYLNASNPSNFSRMHVAATKGYEKLAPTEYNIRNTQKTPWRSTNALPTI